MYYGSMNDQGMNYEITPGRLLCVAVERRKLEFVKAIIETGFNIGGYEIIERRQSILEFAIECGDVEILYSLWKASPLGHLGDLLKVTMEKKPDFFWDLMKYEPSPRYWRTTALKVAVQCEKESVLEELVSLGAEPNHDDILQDAIEHHPSMVRPLLNQYWKVYPQGCPGYGYDIVKRALGLYSKSPELLYKTFAWNLINANLSFQNYPQRGALIYWAIVHTRNYDIVKKFAFTSSDINAVTKPGISNDNEQSTALLGAIETGVIEIVQLLIDHGAEVNKPAQFKIPRAPLQKAAEIDSIPIVRLLLQNNANVNAAPANFLGATALQFAAINGNIEMATILIEYGALLSAPPAVRRRC